MGCTGRRWVGFKDGLRVPNRERVRNSLCIIGKRVFVLVIVVIKLWRPVWRRAFVIIGRHGAIHPSLVERGGNRRVLFPKLANDQFA